MPRLLSALSALLLTGLAGCSPRGAPPAAPVPVVLISIDTLRADHLPAYGYRGVETPALDALRRDAILFSSAWSPCPMTLPAHATMLTGLLPPAHGVRSNVGFTVPAAGSLPRLLRARGYATGAAVSAYVLRRETGLAALFDAYDDEIDPGPGAAFTDYQRPGQLTAERAQAWVSAHSSGPFFLFLHLYEPHAPYEPPEPFRSRYPHAPYDGEIAAADAIVGGFLDRLRAAGLYDRALIVVTSDHGEGLGDHGEAQHSILLYREAIQVPLLVKRPGGLQGGTTVEAPAQLADILPTVLEVVGAEVPPGLPGRSLLHLAEIPRRRLYAETLYPSLQLGWAALRSLTDGRQHYVAGPRPELFDLAADPGERQDRAAQEPAAAAALAREVEAAYPLRLAAPAAVDPDAAERLAALGYLGHAGPAPLTGTLNPRDMLPAFARLQDAAALAQARRPDEAERAYRALLADQPDMGEAWVQLGDLLSHEGRGADAVAAYDQALGRTPGLLDVVLARGLALAKAGRWAEAEAAATRAAPALPRRAEELRTRIALSRGDLPDAEAHARATVGADASPRPSALLLLATVRTRAGDYAGALATLDQAAQRAEALRLGRLRELDFLRADALARAGRPVEAEAAYAREIEAFPDELQAWANLAVLRFLRGDRVGVEALLQEMTRANPGSRAKRVAAATLDALARGPSAAPPRK